MKLKYLWWINGVLLLMTIGPALLFGIGLLLNILSGCDIRNEGGEPYGDCPQWQADFVYSLMMMPWLLMLSVPLVGPIFLIALFITIGCYLVRCWRIMRK